jgi:UDP-galactopyranose mutase
VAIYVDFLIVGAGFSGLVLAERLSSQLGKHCLIIEERDHIGGNAWDEYDDAGVLIHTYGPHYFRTNSPRSRNVFPNSPAGTWWIIASCITPMGRRR